MFKKQTIILFILMIIVLPKLPNSTKEQYINSAENFTKEDSMRLIESFEYLSTKLDSLEQDNKEIYTYFYDKELKLKQEYITYSTRIVSRSSDFILNTSEINSKRFTIQDILALDLRTRSALTAYEINNYILKGTKLEGLGEAFVQAEIDHSINALFLLSLGIHESSYGSSDIARDKNNLFGLGAYDSNPYKHALYFKTKSECIDFAGEHIFNKYLKSNASFFGDGYTLRHINKKYASDPLWGEKIAKHMYNINSTIINRQELRD